jgi:hypothetical protein
MFDRCINLIRCPPTNLLLYNLLILRLKTVAVTVRHILVLIRVTPIVLHNHSIIGVQGALEDLLSILLLAIEFLLRIIVEARVVGGRAMGGRVLTIFAILTARPHILAILVDCVLGIDSPLLGTTPIPYPLHPLLSLTLSLGLQLLSSANVLDLNGQVIHNQEHLEEEHDCQDEIVSIAEQRPHNWTWVYEGEL